MVVAIDVGELAESARAMTRLIEIRGKAVDEDVLDKLVDAVTRDDYRASDDPAKVVGSSSSNEGFGLLPTIERLFDNTILSRISDNPRVWRAHARLLRWKGDWSEAMEDYFRAYRCGPVSDPGVERDKEKFVEAAGEVVELVHVMSLLEPQASDRGLNGIGRNKSDWKFQARGIIRTFLGRTRDS